MGKAVQCFYCHKFARIDDVVLMRNKHSTIRRWFHKRAPGVRDCAGLINEGDWEEIDRNLGETTIDEERQL